MGSFQPGLSLSSDCRAEISARPKNKILVKYSERLHDGNFSRAEFIVNKSFKCTRTVIFLGPVVRKVDSAIHRIVNFSTAAKRHERQWP